MRLFAQIISILFHPLLITVYVYAVLIFFYPYADISNNQYKYAVLGLVFFGTCFVPAVSVLLMHQLGLVTELTINDRSERGTPYLLTTIIYLFIYYTIFPKVGLAASLSFPLLVISLLIAFVAIVNFFWKISAHAVAVGGLCGLTIWITYTSIESSILLVVGSFILAGSTMSARLILKAHTHLQVYTGFVVGLIASFFAYSFR